MLRKGILLAAIAAIAMGAAPVQAADTYDVDAVHSSVEFKVRHLVSKTTGRFDDFSGTIMIDQDDLTGSTVEFTVQTGSIDSNNDDRDGHLKGPDFFDAEKFPTITFKSTKVEATDDADVYHVTGDFTLRGVTKEITIPVEVLGFGPSPWGKGAAGFETSFEVNRKDYGMEWNKALDTGGFILGNDVEVNITIEAAMQ